MTNTSITPEPRDTGDATKARPSSSLVKFWQIVLTAIRKANSHWIGDLLGALSIFIIAYGVALAGWVLQ